jgi:cytochrome c peroxidase
MCLRRWFAILSVAAGVQAETLPVPLGLDAYVPAPESNPLTREKVDLGRALFFFRGLSADGTLSCGDCHVPARSFTDGRARAVGVRGQVGPRRTPPILNRAWGKAFFWDGRTATLEDQVLQPVLNPLEMGLRLEDIAPRVRADAAVNSRFKAVFQRDAENEDVAMALACYVRSILSGDSPYDRYVAGDRAALTSEQQLGLKLFRGKANCAACHVGPNLTDERLHNTGAGWKDGAFKTPTLREVAGVAPYMHDGSLATLEDVIDFYNKGGRDNPGLDPEMRELELTVEEKRALIAFLKSLSGKVTEGWPAH